MILDDDEPKSRGRIDYRTPGGSILHPKLGDKVGFREGNHWILYKVYDISSAPEVGYPGCMSGGLYTLRAPQPQFKGENVITATREDIQFPPQGPEGEDQWDVTD
ncbi:unnamed protein product [Rhizoctonia solani]|uniref:Uncharacterized protein n=1 Tax=Rhizoctonia solani TaxID=456999 RepID=A0A8H3CXL4_9AGAM|nr:unnamed protein product [Rhizoctonia solani]